MNLAPPVLPLPLRMTWLWHGVEAPSGVVTHLGVHHHQKSPGSNSGETNTAQWATTTGGPRGSNATAEAAAVTEEWIFCLCFWGMGA